MARNDTRTVTVHRNGKSFTRRQPRHHRINRRIMKREIGRLKEQKAVVEENIRKARKRARSVI